MRSVEEKHCGVRLTPSNFGHHCFLGDDTLCSSHASVQFFDHFPSCGLVLLPIRTCIPIATSSLVQSLPGMKTRQARNWQFQTLAHKQHESRQPHVRGKSKAHHHHHRSHVCVRVWHVKRCRHRRYISCALTLCHRLSASV